MVKHILFLILFIFLSCYEVQLTEAEKLYVIDKKDDAKKNMHLQIRRKS